MGLFKITKKNKSKNNPQMKVYQQSVDILESIVEKFLTAGIIDLSDNSYLVLKDMTHKTQMNARHNYKEFFSTWMIPFLKENTDKGMELASITKLQEKLKKNKKISFDYHIITGRWLRCTWTYLKKMDVLVIKFFCTVMMLHKNMKETLCFLKKIRKEKQLFKG